MDKFFDRIASICSRCIEVRTTPSCAAVVSSAGHRFVFNTFLSFTTCQLYILTQLAIPGLTITRGGYWVEN
jgi:hypothetical protein